MMIKMHTSASNPVVRPRRAWLVALFWAAPFLMAIASAPACAGEAAAADMPAALDAPSSTVQGPDLSSMSEQELQDYLAGVRTEFVQIRKDLRQYSTLAEENGRGKELLQEMKDLRKELGLLDIQAEQWPEKADDLANRALVLRHQLHEKEAERLALLDQSEEYRKLSGRESELKEQLRLILPALQEKAQEDNAEKMK
jgi:hypothetical protein